MFPFRKESIIFQAHEYLSSNFIFFLFENDNQVGDSLKYKLEETIDEGILTEFKSSINKAFKNITFFDYLYFINRKSTPSKPEKDVNYPSYMVDIAASNSNYLSKIDEDEKDLFNHDEISINEQETCERVIICEENDVVDNGENLCF